MWLLFTKCPFSQPKSTYSLLLTLSHRMRVSPVVSVASVIAVGLLAAVTREEDERAKELT